MPAQPANSLPTPYYQTPDGTVTLYHGDCREIVPNMCREIVDGIVTDPPYAIMGGGASVAGKGTDEAFNLQFYEAWLKEVLQMSYDILPARGAMWWTSDFRGAVAADRVLCRIGTYGERMRLAAVGVWDRGGLGMGYALRKTYEVFCLAVRHNWKRNSTDTPDVWRVQWTPGDRTTGHQAEKPVALMGKAIQLCGSTAILDPFAGSGTTLVAARNLGRRAIGIEISEEYCEIAAGRLGAVHAANETEPLLAMMQEAGQ